MESKIIKIPIELLPEARNWSVGKVYRVKMVLRQTGAGENYAEFEVVDATSLENPDKATRFFISEGGAYKS